MKINPKTYTLDANDRAVILAALACYRDARNRAANRKATSQKYAYRERVKIEIDAIKTDAARASDLIATLEG